MEAVVRGMGDSPLQSLCSQTLRGWHTQALASGPREVRLADSVDLRSMEFRPEILAAARELGCGADAEGLVERLRTGSATRRLVGPIHGDLHARNVHVRNGEAILIDFRSTRTGPIALDFATLEISIAFDRYGAGSSQGSWTKMVDGLYCAASIGAPAAAPVAPCPESWLWRTVQYIRQQAQWLGIGPLEYREVLAVQLLRRACFRVELERPGDEHRRAYAVVLAARLVGSLCGTRST